MRLLSQGRHVCDIGVLFPTTAIQAQTSPTGPLPAANAAHDAYLALVGSMAWHDTRPGVLDRDRRDYDVLDDDSVQRATVEDGTLVIGAERYRTIVLPSCAALATATAEVLGRFVEAGGLLIAVGQIPASAVGAGPAEAVERLGVLFAEGRAIRVARAEDLPAVLARIPRDVPRRRRSRLCVTESASGMCSSIPAAFPRATEVSPTVDWREVAYTFSTPLAMPARWSGCAGSSARHSSGGPLTGTLRDPAATVVDDAVEVVLPFDRGPAAVLVWPARGEEEAWAGHPRPRRALQLERLEELEPTLDNRYGYSTGGVSRPAAGPDLAL